jgi:RNA polymerase sigma-70 factor (ECF subfamily)
VDNRHDFERLYREEGARIWRVVYGIAGGRTEVAEEAVAEAFARAMEHSERIRDPLGWIFRTAFRLVGEELRRERRRSLFGSSAPVASDDPNGLQDLVRALRRLSANQRVALILHRVEDLPIDEVARLMGVSPATVRVHIHRGRRRLRRLLGTEEERDG